MPLPWKILRSVWIKKLGAMFTNFTAAYETYGTLKACQITPIITSWQVYGQNGDGVCVKLQLNPHCHSCKEKQTRSSKKKNNLSGIWAGHIPFMLDQGPMERMLDQDRATLLPIIENGN